MSWVILSLVSALVLGVYDVLKKRSVVGNAVIPVLFVSVCASAMVWIPLVVWSGLDPVSFPVEALRVQYLDAKGHGLLFLKSAIVATSWVLSYFALKHLPVSIATPIRATSPLWTFLGAVVFLGERPAIVQLAGIAITIVFFFLLSIAGRNEGIVFHRDRWILCIVSATLVGAVSSLYDKVLLSTIGYDPATVQAWFSIYLVVVMLPLMVGWIRRWWPRSTFQWRWSIPLIGLSLLAADFAYFTALSREESLVSVVSCLRRASVVVTFVAGYVLFRERNYRRKLPCLAGIMAGIVLVLLG